MALGSGSQTDKELLQHVATLFLPTSHSVSPGGSLQDATILSRSGSGFKHGACLERFNAWPRGRRFIEQSRRTHSAPASWQDSFIR